MEEILDRIITIYSSESKDVRPLATNFDEARLLKMYYGNSYAPLKLSYHGECHYNSVFDEAVQLPLNVASTTKLLESRTKAFET